MLECVLKGGPVRAESSPRIASAQLAPLRRARYALTLLGALAATPVLAQQGVHTIRGVVRDRALAPLAGVEVILLNPRRNTLTDAAGRFSFDSVPEGVRNLVIRRIGYLPVRPGVRLPQDADDTVNAVLLAAAQSLPTLIVKPEPPGIRGVVGDSALHPLPGSVVELVGARRADTADAAGQFAFEGIKQGHYMLRVSRDGYVARLLSINLGNHLREYSILLNRPGARGFDWAASREGKFAMQDLGFRLAVHFRRSRLTRAELERYGSLPLCNIPYMEIHGPWILVRGSPSMVPDICNWNADEVELVEWGKNYCGEISGTIKRALGDESCTAIPVFESRNRRTPPRGWVNIWPRT